ncbi:MAG: phosphomannomutase/phosphoglucomutase [Parcubacteria group bacterium]|nr:phosphomannomutase/phosphoglucomutase [Parcubacteria group bacterium]
MNINAAIFRRYDIRGIYPEELNEHAVEAIARAFVRLLAERGMAGPVIVGRDVRTSSESLAHSCTRALLSAGAAVYDIGVVTTPLLHFAVGTTPDAAGGIMITASHNPAEYNGMKFLLRGVHQLSYENGISQMQKMTTGGTALALPKGVEKGAVNPCDYFPAYKKFLCAHAHVQKKVKVVVDAGGGSAGKFLPAVLSCMNVEHVPLFFDADGTFSAHPPNPLLPEAQAILSKAVQNENADFGVAFDADADRIVAADECGKIVAPDILGLLLADALTEEGEEVIADVRVTHTLRELMREKRGNVYVSRVGTTYIKEFMQQRNARFAFESSGHYYFREFFGADSALLAFMHLVNIVSRSRQPLGELIEKFKKTAQSGERNFTIRNWDALAKTIRETYRDGTQSFIDGITAEYADWWFNIRPSATEPLVRVNIEARTPELLRQKEKKLEETLLLHERKDI